MLGRPTWRDILRHGGPMPRIRGGVDFAVSDWSRFYTYPDTAGATYGLALTGGAANTKGAWATLKDPTPFHASGILFHIADCDNTGDYLIDVAYGTTLGADSTLTPAIQNIYFGGSIVDGTTTHDPVFIPLTIPGGRRLAACCQSTTASGIINISVTLLAGGFPGCPSFGRATTYGANTANSRGTLVDPGGVASTKGAWSVLSASTTNNMQWIVVCLGRLDTTMTNQRGRLDLGVGVALSEQYVLNDINYTLRSSKGFQPGFLSFPCAKKGASRLVTRAQSSDITAENQIYALAIGLD